ncbi:MAG: hypothetical protein IMZ52_05380 [Actinobacteria bacterium]|nr:hypothetical protein [Actinomycetota bacterium]
MLQEKVNNIDATPEVFTRYLINEVNRFLNGEEVPIDKVRNGLSELATRSDNLKNSFDRTDDFNTWKGTVKAAASWARGADRSKSPQFNMGLDPTDGRRIIKGIKSTFNAIRNLGGEVGTENAGTFYWANEKAVPEHLKELKQNKAKLEFNNLLVVPKEEYIGLPSEALWEKWFKGKDAIKEAEKKLPKGEDIEDFVDVFTDQVIAKEAANRGYDGILYRLPNGNDIVQDLRGMKDRLTNKRTGGTTFTMGVDPNHHNPAHYEQYSEPGYVPGLFKGFHGTSSKYIKPENIVGKTLTPKSVDEIVREVLDELKLTEKEKEIVKPLIYEDDYYTISPNNKKQVYATKEFEDASEYASAAGEAYDSTLSTLTTDIRVPKYIRDKAQEMFDKNRAATPYVLEVAFDKPLKEGDNISSNPVKVTGVYDTKGIKLYSGIDPTQIKKLFSPILEFMKEFDDSTNTKKFDFLYAIKKAKVDADRALSDQSEALLKEVRHLYPKESQKIIDRQRSAVNGKGYGEIEYKEMLDEVFSGKTTDQVRLINAYILARRFNDIYSYRTSNEYKHQPGYGPNQSISTTSTIEMVKDIPDNVWSQLFNMPEVKQAFGKVSQLDVAKAVRAGESFFEWHRKIIDDLVEAGMKTEEEGNLLKSHDYRKFKTISVEKLYDFDYNIQLKGETIRSTNSGVESLGHGSTKIIDPDARICT